MFEKPLIYVHLDTKKKVAAAAERSMNEDKWMPHDGDTSHVQFRPTE